MNNKNRGVRSQDSRQRLISGAIESILKVGYANTSVGELVKRAGLSKGAHVYHFKSKLDLMTVTINYLFEDLNRRLREVIPEPPRSLKDVEQNLQTIAELTLDTEGSALLEVWMASRTDADLRRVFSKLEAANERVHKDWMVHIFGQKVVDSTDIAHVMEGAIWIIRGLALQNIVQKNVAAGDSWAYWRGKLAADLYGCMRRAA